MTRFLALALLLAAPGALAQQHDHGEMNHDVQGATMPADSLWALHARMMADPEIHAAMRADAEMQAVMAALMPMDHGSMNHGAMEGMDHAEMDAEARAMMMRRMRERLAALPEAERQGVLARMEAAHVRLMAAPEVHGRMMADPSMRRMMEAMPGGMPGMEGMDHGAGTDMTEGMAMQRRNAGVPDGDEATRVGTAAFDASATADRFHAALAAGDRATVETLLLPDAVVLEGGAHESRAEYLSHHFARDAAFLGSVTTEPVFRRTTVAGDAAWVASTQRVGDAAMAELLVLRQTDAGWRVAAVHWSSARE